MFYSQKYVAGNSIQDLLPVVKKMNLQNVKCSISYLPIKKTGPQEIKQDTLEYFDLLETIAKEKLDADITVKLTQFGINSNPRLAKEATEQIVKYAASLENFVWIDVETAPTLDATQKIFKDLHSTFPLTGICVQAFRKRSKNDLINLLKNKVPLRFVKGYYFDSDLASWAEVTANYSKLMEFVLLNSSMPAIATHDRELIEKAKNIIQKNNIKNYEFQFFYGFCNDYAAELANKGYNVRVYIPYGKVFTYLFETLPIIDKPRYFQRAIGLTKIR